MWQQRLQKRAFQDLFTLLSISRYNRQNYPFPFQTCYILLLLIWVMASCGSQASSTLAPGAPSATTAPALEPAYSYSKSQTVSGLFVNLDGFICTEGPFLSNLIIASKQTSYDVGSAQSIQNYIQLIETNAYEDPDTGLVEWIPPQPPKELQWVAGSTACTGDLAITNTRSSAVEIQSFGLQLTSPPLRNTVDYRRIALQETCSACGGVPPCAYTVSVALDGGATGHHFDSPVESTDGVHCPVPMIIPTSGSIELLVTFHDAKMRDMIYTGMPELFLANEKPIEMSVLTSRLSFIHTDALPCYQFQSEAFVSLPCSHS